MDGSMAERQQALITGLAEELAAVVGALLGSKASAAAGSGPPSPGWAITCGLAGPLAGTLTVAVSDPDASALARRLMGMDEDPPQDAVMDALGEVIGQAAGGLTQKPAAGGAKIHVEGTAVHGGSLPAAPPAVFDVAMEDGSSLRFACWASVEEGAPAVAPPQPEAAARPSPGGADPAPQASPVRPQPVIENLDVILDIELPLTVRFGKTELALQALTQLGPGSVIDLDRSPDEPVDVLINDKVIARGEVVVVAGNYGVRVTEVMSAVDRIRTFGE